MGLLRDDILHVQCVQWAPHYPYSKISLLQTWMKRVLRKGDTIECYRPGWTHSKLEKYFDSVPVEGESRPGL